jgi:hypothetical protein
LRDLPAAFWLQKAKASTVLSRLKRNKAKVALRLAHSIMPQQQQQLLDLRQSALIAGGRGSQCAENCSTSRENFNLISRQRNELMLRVSGAIISKKPWTGASERARARATCRFTLFRGAPYCEGEKMVLRSGSQKSISQLSRGNIFCPSKVNIAAVVLLGKQVRAYEHKTADGSKSLKYLLICHLYKLQTL